MPPGCDIQLTVQLEPPHIAAVACATFPGSIVELQWKMDENALAKERMFAELYHELHRLAQRALLRDGRQLSITPTTLLHESYLSVSKADFPDSQRFLAYAARTMHGLIIDEIRRRKALKNGGAFAMTRIEPALESEHAAPARRDDELMRIDDALAELASKDPALAELVQLRYFCGLSIAQVAVLRGVNKRTVQRQWEKARLLLFDMLKHPARVVDRNQ